MRIILVSAPNIYDISKASKQVFKNQPKFSIRRKVYADKIDDIPGL